MRNEGPYHIHVTFPTYTILSKVHVCRKDVRASTMLPQFSKTPRKKGWTHYSFTEDILLQRALTTSVVLQCDIPICAESYGEHSDLAKHRFSTANVCEMVIQQVRQDIQGFIKNVRHLIPKVLRSHCVVKHQVKK